MVHDALLQLQVLAQRLDVELQNAATLPWTKQIRQLCQRLNPSVFGKVGQFILSAAQFPDSSHLWHGFVTATVHCVTLHAHDAELMTTKNAPVLVMSSCSEGVIVVLHESSLNCRSLIVI
jgi:hypothetical protein